MSQWQTRVKQDLSRRRARRNTRKQSANRGVAEDPLNLAPKPRESPGRGLFLQGLQAGVVRRTKSRGPEVYFQAYMSIIYIYDRFGEDQGL